MVSPKKFATDSNIFYIGIPYQSTFDYIYFITPEIYDEIKHIKKNIDALDLLLTLGKVRLIDASKDNISKVRKKEIEVGQKRLSLADCSVIALGLQLNIPILSTDFSLVNLAKHLCLKTEIPGKKNFTMRTTMKYCSICKLFFTNSMEFCKECGNLLVIRRKI